MLNHIVIPKSNVELLKECKITTFRSKGRDGQHLNNTESAVRLKHIKTGIVTISQKHRSQYQNKKQFLNKSDLDK